MRGAAGHRRPRPSSRARPRLPRNGRPHPEGARPGRQSPASPRQQRRRRAAEGSEEGARRKCRSLGAPRRLLPPAPALAAAQKMAAKAQGGIRLSAVSAAGSGPGGNGLSFSPHLGGFPPHPTGGGAAWAVRGGSGVACARPAAVEGQAALERRELLSRRLNGSSLSPQRERSRRGARPPLSGGLKSCRPSLGKGEPPSPSPQINQHPPPPCLGLPARPARPPIVPGPGLCSLAGGAAGTRGCRAGVWRAGTPGGPRSAGPGRGGAGREGNLRHPCGHRSGCVSSGGAGGGVTVCGWVGSGVGGGRGFHSLL